MPRGKPIAWIWQPPLPQVPGYPPHMGTDVISLCSNLVERPIERPPGQKSGTSHLVLGYKCPEGSVSVTLSGKTYLYKASNSYSWSELFPSPLGDGIIRFLGLGKACSLFPLFFLCLWSSFPFNQSTCSWTSNYSAFSAASLLLHLPWLLLTACCFQKSNPLSLPYHRLSMSGLWV